MSEDIKREDVEAQLKSLKESRAQVVANLSGHDGAIQILEKLLSPKPE